MLEEKDRWELANQQKITFINSMWTLIESDDWQGQMVRKSEENLTACLDDDEAYVIPWNNPSLKNSFTFQKFWVLFQF